MEPKTITEQRNNSNGLLCRPWRRVKRNHKVETVYVLARQNYKVYESIGLTRHALTRFAAVLDTGAGESFIRKDVIPPELQKHIIKDRTNIAVRDANGRRVAVAGLIELTVDVGGRLEVVRFKVNERLSTEVILGCDYCDKHVEYIRPRMREVELDDGNIVPIIRPVGNRSRNQTPLPAAQRYQPLVKRPTDKVKVSTSVTLEPGMQTCVKVKSDRVGLVLIEPHRGISRDQTCLTGTAVHQIVEGKYFHVLVDNFGAHPVKLTQGQTIAKAHDHPTTIITSNVPHGEMLGVITKKDAYRKRNSDKRDVDVINRHLTNGHEDHLNDDESTITAETVELKVEEKYHPEIWAMLKKHESMWSGKLGEINVTQNAISLKPGARPFKSAPYRAGHKARELERAEINKQLSAGVIEPSQSEWAAPVLFVPKKDGSLRFCIDFRRLIEMTIRDSYLLPRMDECIDSLGSAKVFTTLDDFSGYWQIPVRAEDRAKTYFLCHEGTYQYSRLPFGLTNVPASFQRALDMILAKLKWQTFLVYIDDVIIYSNSVEEHIKHDNEMLTVLREAGATLKISKYTLFSDTVEYLGHVIRPSELHIDDANMKSLRDAKLPTTVSHIRYLLGLCNVYRRFIEGFAHIADPLEQLLRKGTGHVHPQQRTGPGVSNIH